ncbi:MAG: hypothetical protein Q8880_08355 [Bacteroidota bacterium]|nr:hypothetical protein [Bacteroidota bacterium]
MKIKYLLLYIALITFFSCSNRHEVVEKKYPDGSPKVVKIYEGSGADKKLVKEISYYPGKKKYIEGEIKHDSIKDGKWTVWYQNGKVWSEGYFKDDKADGKRTVYYENGNKRYEGEFKDGVRTGTWNFYDEQGKLVNTQK